MDNREVVYKLLCTDLGRSPAQVPEDVRDYMLSRIDAARARLEKDGVNVDSGEADALDLWVMYAAYLYRRRDSDAAMPRSLRLALNDAKVSSAIGRAGT